jgi:hypothetical protein
MSVKGWRIIKCDIIRAFSLNAVALSMLQSNDGNRAPTEVVQISAYRDRSHRRNVASSRLFSIQYSIRGILINLQQILLIDPSRVFSTTFFLLMYFILCFL